MVLRTIVGRLLIVGTVLRVVRSEGGQGKGRLDESERLTWREF